MFFFVLWYEIYTLYVLATVQLVFWYFDYGIFFRRMGKQVIIISKSKENSFSKLVCTTKFPFLTKTLTLVSNVSTFWTNYALIPIL